MPANRPPEVPNLPCCVGDQPGGMYRTPETIEEMKNKCMRPGEFCRKSVPNPNPEPVAWWVGKDCRDCVHFHYDREIRWWSGECRRTKKAEYRNFQQMQEACEHFEAKGDDGRTR